MKAPLAVKPAGLCFSFFLGESVETYAYDALGRETGHDSELGRFAMTYLGETGQIATRTLVDPTPLACPGSVRSRQAA